MDVDLWARLAAAPLVLILVAASSASLSALVHLNRGRLRYLAAEGLPRARSLVSLLDDAPFLETTMATMNAVAMASSAALPLLLFAGYLTSNPAVFYGMGVAGVVALLCVQLISRSLGALHPEETLYLLQRLLVASHLLVGPFVVLGRRFAVALFPAARGLSASLADGSAEELRMMVGAVEEERGLEEEEREMIHGIFEMGETTAREIMVPRVDMVAVEADEPLREVLDRIKDRGHSRIPIFEENIDNIVGVVHAKDLLRHMEKKSLQEPARSLARAPYFTPESKKIDELLHEMQRNNIQMSIVVDEYGGTAGLVTIEDLLEQIVGEIHDEYDVEEKPIEKLGELEAVFDARVSIDDVNETLRVSLTDGEYGTVGGFAYDRLGKIPVAGDQVQVDGITLTVLSAVGKRIKKVKIHVDPKASAVRARNGRE